MNKLPEFKEDIHHLKMVGSHFKKLHDESQHLAREVEKREQEIIPSTTTFDEERLKKYQLLLKGTLHYYIKASIRASTKAAVNQSLMASAYLNTGTSSLLSC